GGRVSTGARTHTGAARTSVREVRDHERRRAVAERETGARTIEGPAGLQVERLQGVEARVGEPADLVRTDRERDRRLAAPDRIGRGRDRERARRAGGGEGRARAEDAERLAHDRGRGRE